MNLRMIRTLNSCPLGIAPVHSRVEECGGESAPAMAKADRLAAERLRKKCHRAEETTEEHAARQQSYMPFCARCGQIYIYIYIYIFMYYVPIKISNRTQSLALQ